MRHQAFRLLRGSTGEDQQGDQRPVFVHQHVLLSGRNVCHVPHQRHLRCCTNFIPFLTLIFKLYAITELSVRPSIKTSTWHHPLFLPLSLVASAGAHLNPAVTLSFCVLGQVPWKRMLPYWLFQVLGAYVASALVYMVYFGLSFGSRTIFGEFWILDSL